MALTLVRQPVQAGSFACPGDPFCADETPWKPMMWGWAMAEGACCGEMTKVLLSLCPLLTHPHPAWPSVPALGCCGTYPHPTGSLPKLWMVLRPWAPLPPDGSQGPPSERWRGLPKLPPGELGTYRTLVAGRTELLLFFC